MKKIFVVILFLVSFLSCNVLFAQIEVKSLEFIPREGLKNIFTYEKAVGKLILKNNSNEAVNNLKFAVEVKKEKEVDWQKISEGVVGLSSERERSFDFSYVFKNSGNYNVRVKLASDNIKGEIIPNEKSVGVYKNIDIRPVSFNYVNKNKGKDLFAPVDGQFTLTLINNGKEPSQDFTYRILIDGKAMGKDFSVDNVESNQKKTLINDYKFETRQFGRHEIKAVIDPNNELGELNEEANQISKEIIVYSVDAQIEELLLVLKDEPADILKQKDSTEISKGTEAKFRIKVKNTGNVSINEVKGELLIKGVKNSASPFILKGILPYGGSKTAEISFKLDTAGSFNVEVWLDKDNLINEIDENNNVVSASLIVK